MYRLLPSAIDDILRVHEDRTTGMQLQATPSNTQPKRPLAPSPTAHESTKRNALCINNKTYAQRYQERLAGYRATREHDLQEPFHHNPTPTGCAENSAPLHGGHSGIVEKPQPLRIPKYEVTQNHTPLSNDAIARILLQCTPNSLKAQAWINAHKASTAARERMKALLRERDGLRKQVLQLRPKSEWTTVAKSKSKEPANEVDERSEEGREMPSRIPTKDGKSNTIGVKHRGIADVLDDEDEQMVSVFKSSGRLQILACDHETPADVSGRIKRELRMYFGSSGEK